MSALGVTIHHVLRNVPRSSELVEAGEMSKNDPRSTLPEMFRIVLHALSTYLNPVRCPVCLSPECRFVTRNRSSFIHRCGSCTHAFVANPRPFDLQYKRYCGMAYWDGDRHHQGIRSVDKADEGEHFVARRMAVLEHFRAIPQDFPTGKRPVCLEIGCSEGKLLESLARKGFQVEGNEVNPEIAALGAEHLGLKIRVEPFEAAAYTPESYDLIVSFHTFEHFLNPLDMTRKACALLKPGGKLILEVPTDDRELRNCDHLHFFTLHSAEVMVASLFRELAFLEGIYNETLPSPWKTVFICGTRGSS